jgi:phosphoserine phosphatase RsbU/P
MPDLSVASDLGAVDGAVRWADGVFQGLEVPETLRSDIQVCLEEALANLIVHGRREDGDKGIAVTLACEGAGAVVSIRDRCVPFDAATALIPPPPTGPDAPPGGHGLRLIRMLSSRLTYRAGPDGNELRMFFESAVAKPVSTAFEDEPVALEPGILSILQRIHAFRAAPEPVLRTMLEAVEETRFEAGARLVMQDTVSLNALILLSGSVTIANESQHGAMPLATITAPALVGEIGALTGLPRTASIFAAEPVRAFVVSQDALKRAVAFAPEILTAVVWQLGQQIQTINSALGLYSAGLTALERDELDPTILEDLKNPSPALASFGAAFAGLARRITAERRSRDEMNSAILIQRAMLPADIDTAGLRGRCDVKGDMKPARQVGGDFYDAFMLDADRLVIAVGDVCGKGVPASLFMSVTVTTLRLAAKQRDPLPLMIERVNALLCEQNAAAMFSTLFYGILDLTCGRLEYVNCGHNPPFLMRRKGEVVPLAPGGAPLGLLPGRSWPGHETILGPGDGLLLYTDGITESVSTAGDEFGEQRLLDVLHRRGASTASELVESCIADVERFAVGAEQFDDITCLAVLMAEDLGASA